MDGLAKVLARQYAIISAAITPLEGGLSALAFRVDAADGGSYVLKVYDKAKTAAAEWISRIDGYMPVLLWLNGHTALRGSIVEPVYTADGHCEHEDGQSVYLLSRYAEGETVGERELTEGQAGELGHILGLLHCHGESDLPCTQGLPREDFSLPFCDSLERLIENGMPDSEAVQLLWGHRQTLAEAIGRCRLLATGMSRQNQELVLCHADPHNYNLIQGSRLVLIDWEGMMLARPERDLMFFARKPTSEAFLEAYRRHRPGYVIDPVMLEFYLLRRDLEDIWAFAQTVLYDNPDEAERKQAMGFLRGLLRQLNQPKDCWRIGTQC